MDAQWTCEWVECPAPYIAPPIGVDFNRTSPGQGPYGERNTSKPEYGLCPRDSAHFTDDEVLSLGECV